MRPLSFGQQRLWFLDQLEGPSATYNVPYLLRLRGRLDRQALRDALADLLERHEVLRTVIPVSGGVPGQDVLPAGQAAVRLGFPVVRLREEALADALAGEVARPFDLAAELPVRVTLFELGVDEHVLLLVLHHIACDGWSLGPLARDLGTAYAARREGEAPDWLPLPVQYLDFSEWQREVLGTEDDPDSLLSAQLAYWTEHLAGVPDRMRLPVHRSGTEPRQAGIVAVDLPAESHAGLLAVTRAARCTPFMGLQAALSATLSRWGAGEDVVLGTPVAGRGEEALTDLIGFFVNTLVLRNDLSGDPSLTELLDRVRATNLSAYSNQDVPFDRLVDRLVTDRSAEAHPLFQVMVVQQHDDPAEIQLPGLDVRREQIDVATAKLDLSVVFAEKYIDGTPSGIACQIEFATDLFDQSTVEELAETLVRLLDAALAAPDRPMSSLDVGGGYAPVVAEKAPQQQEIPSRQARNAREEILCGLFADVLGLETVGIDDGFFALGGHSLLATQLISRIRGALNAELGVRALFRAPTVAGILATLDSQGDVPARPALVPRPRPAEVPLSFAQQRLWFLAGVEGQDRAYTIPLTLRLTGAVDRDALAAACRDLVERHETLRTVFPVTDGTPRQHVLSPAEAGPILAVADCGQDELPALLDATGSAPFDLALEIPLRATLFLLTETESVLVLCLHHIAADGWSVGTLMRDLVTAYEARLAGVTPDWSPLPVQYVDYTLWQADLLDAEGDRQVDYWTGALAGLPDELALPVDRPRPATPSHRKDVVTSEVDASVHAALVKMARENQATLFMVTQAAFAALLSRMGAGEDIPIGTPIAGRTDEALDDLVGFFVNTLVLRTDLSGTPSFRELLARVRDTDLTAYGHQDLPFDRLVEILNPVRAADRHPLFQVMLSFLGGDSGAAEWTLPGLTARAEDTVAGTAKFDLTLTIDEHRSEVPQGLTCFLEFATDLFDRATAQSLADRLVRLLAAVAVEPDVPVGRIDVLFAEEHEVLARLLVRDTRAHVLNDQLAPVPPGVAGDLYLTADDPAGEGELFDAAGQRMYRTGDLVRWTRNGVVEYVEQAAPAPELTTRSIRGPRNAQEEILCGLFADVLGLDSVGVDDGFFALGGHSLPATRLISRARSALGVELSIRDLFRAQTVARLAELLDHGHAARPALSALPRPDTLPLSYAQQRLWFILQLDDDNGAYDVPCALRLRGHLDRVALTAALGDVVARHEVLRTVFPEIDGEPRQLVLPDWRPDLAVVDCGEAGLDEALATAAAQRFTLAEEPPFRAGLFAVAEDDHVLLLVMHHIASDGWSMGPLTRDLAEAYRARCGDVAPSWAPLPVQYGDYTLWQRDLLGDPDDTDSLMGGQLTYWRERLAGVPDELVLPFDRPRPAVASHRGDSVPVEIDAELRDRLQELARGSQVTLFMVLQAAFATLLSRMGAGDDIPIGTPIAGRTDEALDDLIGFFVNTLVLRTDLSDAPTFRELLGRVRETDLGAYAHQDLPFDRLVEALNPARSLSRHPLFQVMLVLQNAADADLDLPGLRVSGHLLDSDAVKFDLGLALADGLGGISGSLSFAGDLFDRATAERLVESLVRLLAGVVDEPDLPVDRVDIMSSVERERLLVDHNATDAPISEATLPELFSEQAGRTPDAIAVVFEGEALTYREIDGRVEAMAKALRANGVRPGDIVAVSLPRSVELVVALHAVHRSGAAYLPVDPDYPAERVEFMLADARPSLVLTPDTLTLPRVASGDVNLPVVRPNHPAYVIYTSGSTGRPKGVLMSHSGIVNHLMWMQGDYPLGPDDRVLQKTPSSFDVSVWEFFWPLVTGATLVVARPEGHRDPVYLAELIRAEQVTVAHFVPAMLEAFLSLPEATVESTLRQVFCGGEALTPALAERCVATLPARLSNFYGPTEVAVEATHHPYRSVTRSVPIGRPVWNTRAYVLDARLGPVPSGVAGELYLSGIQLADGYLHRGSLTAERFVVDPFGGAGERMYRTGDLVRWTAEGTIEYLGRTDDQVKIRGQRIELGEIAAVATRHPAVGHAVAAVCEDRLVVYVTGEIDPADLRRHIAAFLPEYMVPSAVVCLAELPLGPNGKVDRKALPAPGPAAMTDTYRAPRDPAEEILCGLYADLLGVERVGIDDSFFDLGGHSLLATRLISRARSALGVELTIRDLFQAPAVAGLAMLLDHGRPVRAALRPRVMPERVPLSPAQQRLWFINQMDGRNGGYTVTCALRLRGLLDREAMAAAVADVAGRQEVLRTIFPDVAGEPCQVVLGGTPVELAVRRIEEAGLDSALEAASAATFDLTTDVPFRPELLALAADDHVLLLVMHHIASDGWSMGPLVRDLTAAYTSRCAGEVPSWTPLPVRYRDYTLWQREVLGDAGDPDSVLGSQLGYWRARLAGLPEELALPFDRPRPAVANHAGESVPVEIDADLHGRLLDLARDNHTTLFMVLQAGFAALLSRVGAGEDIPIGTPVAGRTDEAVDDLVGFFVNTLVLRTDLSGMPTFRELLGRVRETDLGAFANQDVAFERLVHELNPARSLGRHPVFQVLLALQNNEDVDPELPGLQVTGLPVGPRTSAFDLALSVHELVPGTASGIGGGLTYRTDLFDRDTVRGLVARLVRLLDAATAEPDRPIGLVDVLSASERHRLLVERTATGQDHGECVPVPYQVAAHAAANPDSLAVVCGDRRLSYSELDRTANQLAWHLVGAGVRRGTLVGICLPRGPELIVAQLAVLRAGGAYVPLDPDYPADRLSFMLSDASAPVTVTRQDLVDRVGTANVICVDSDAAAIAAQPDEAPPISLDARDAAYVIYTSGSTGRPKGVVLDHTGLAHLCAWFHREFGVSPADRASQVAALGFDAAVFEVWPHLTGGASVHLPPRRALEDTGALAEWLAESGITTAFLPTPRLETMLDEPALATAPLRVVVAGGDRLRRRPSPETRFRLVNGYGPTECSVMATGGTVAPAGDDLPDIGVPVPNTRAYVLDRFLNPVPDGVPGELYLAGTGLARGYLGQSGLTSQRFVVDPFGGPGDRMYRTGDVVRWRADGRLEFLGRADDQVKVRGVRIELGEIDAVLGGCAGVRQVATVVREDRPGLRELVSYLVADTDAEAVRAWAATFLPDHMVPSAFVMLDVLPLTPHGKLDVRALPAPARIAGAGRAPRDRRERVLSGLFADVLGLESVSIDDGFFDLGGHSLLAARLISLIRRELGAELGIRALFETPTVAGLAERLSAGTASGGDLARLLPLRTGGDRAPLFCLPPAAGVSWVYAGLLKHIDPARGVYGLQSAGLTDPHDGPSTVELLVKDHVERIRQVQPSGPYNLLGWSFGAQIAHAVAVDLQAQGEEVGLLAMLDGYPPTGSPGLSSERELVAALLLSLGHDLSGLADAAPLGRPEFVERVLTAGGPLAELGAESVAKLPDVFAHNGELARTCQPGGYAGDVLFFQATRGRREGAPTPDAWQPYVSGRVAVHEVEALHGELCQPGPLAQVGEVVAAWLR